jgi:hypothetical protein
MYQERLAKIETICKLPGYDSTNCLKSIVAFANKKCLQTGPKLRAFIYIHWHKIVIVLNKQKHPIET